MSVRLGAVALVLALCAVSVQSQVWGYVSQSFSLVRSDILESAEYTMLANVTSRDGGEVSQSFLCKSSTSFLTDLQTKNRTTRSVCIRLPSGPALLAPSPRRRALRPAACSSTSSDTLPETTPTVSRTDQGGWKEKLLIVDCPRYREGNWSDRARQHFRPAARQWRHLLRDLPGPSGQVPV